MHNLLIDWIRDTLNDPGLRSASILTFCKFDFSIYAVSESKRTSWITAEWFFRGFTFFANAIADGDRRGGCSTFGQFVRWEGRADVMTARRTIDRRISKY